MVSWHASGHVESDPHSDEMDKGGLHASDAKHPGAMTYLSGHEGLTLTDWVNWGSDLYHPLWSNDTSHNWNCHYVLVTTMGIYLRLKVFC